MTDSKISLPTSLFLIMLFGFLHGEQDQWKNVPCFTAIICESGRQNDLKTYYFTLFQYK